MRTSGKETQRAMFECFLGIICLLKITHANPYARPDVHRLIQCGRDTCDGDKSPPEFCNQIETRCEACTIHTCDKKICSEWSNCTSTATPGTEDMTTTRTPVSEIRYDEDTKSDSDTREMEVLQKTVAKLQGEIDILVYGFYGLVIVILVILVIVAILAYKLLRARCPPHFGPRPHPQGSGHSQYPRVDPDETIPMTAHSSADSGIQEANTCSTHLNTERHKRHPHHPVSSGQSSTAMIDEEMVSCEAPLGVKESHYYGKPTAMVL